MRLTNRRDFIKNSVTAGFVFTASGLIIRKTYSGEVSGFSRVVYRDLGSTGFKASEIGFGVLHIQDTALINAAIDSGINYFDTAHSYMNGVCEETLGKVMKTRRNDIFLTTKIGRAEPKKMAEKIDISLKRLQTDHVDLLLLHGASKDNIVNEDIIKTFDNARKSGKTRFVGVSTHDHYDVPDAVIESSFWEALTIPYNYFSPPVVSEKIQKARESGIAIIGMKNLITIARPRKPFPDIRKGKTGGTTNQQALLKWSLSNRYVDTVIPGISTFEHLADDIDIMGKKLTYNDRKILKRYTDNSKGIYCRGIAGCMECRDMCPKGVEVSEINRCINYADGYGNIELARDNYSQLHPSNRIDVCEECDKCVVRCCHGIQLAKNIKKARELFV